MMELTLFLQLAMAFFGLIGYLQGIYREFVATVGLILGLFVITELDWVISFFLGRGDVTLRFIVDSLLLTLFAFFAYQQAPTTFVPSRYRRGRGGVSLPSYSAWQMRLVSALVGAFNGYLIFGSLWYFLDQFEYPLDSWVQMPELGTASADFVNYLPLVWLQQNNLLLIIVIAVFVLVIVFR